MDNLTHIKTRRPLYRLGTAAVLSGMIIASPAASDQPNIDPDAYDILTEMSAYVGGLSGFSANFDASTDVITSQGQKIKLATSGSVAVNRPGQIHFERHGLLAQMEVVLDGEQLTVYGANLNGYFQVPSTSIDETVAVLRDDIGFEFPGADIITSTPLSLEATDTVSGTHVGMTTIAGATVHHLAFRGEEVDWQVWILDGNRPLPVKYVITSKLMAGAPEYTLSMGNWNIDPDFDNTTFSFSPPSSAQRITSLTIDAVGNFSDNSE